LILGFVKFNRHIFEKIKELVVEDKNINKFIEKILYYYYLMIILITFTKYSLLKLYIVKKNECIVDNFEKFDLLKLFNKLYF
jgi:hypothetical protein